MGFQTPVLFIIFNRPDTTSRVFERIRGIKPTRLYVAADGPRASRAGEEHLCAQARSIVEQVDWPCEVKTKFEPTNLGCRRAVSAAIDWFFGAVEEGIILEDDCLPEPDFFAFCAELLNRYRNDPRVMHIGGNNFQKGNKRGESDYYFSVYSHIWGWATWRRAWHLYDVSMRDYSKPGVKKMLQAINPNGHFNAVWAELFERTYQQQIDTWDHQWTYAIWKNHGLAVIPQSNLVMNIGFGMDATHTHSKSWMANLATHPLRIQRHPAALVADQSADFFTAREVYGIHMNKLSYLHWRIRSFFRIRSRLRSLFSEKN